MNQIASKGQLHMSLLRWVLFIVPLFIVLGFVAGQIAGLGEENRWFNALQKPSAQPSGSLFATIWVILFAFLGAAFAMVLHARGAPLRSTAMVLFLVQFALILCWAPLFFGMHQISAAFVLLIITFMFALATTVIFGRIRKTAAWLMVPYLAWLCFTGVLNIQIDWLNPNAETLVVPAARTQI